MTVDLITVVTVLATLVALATAVRELVQARQRLTRARVEAATARLAVEQFDAIESVERTTQPVVELPKPDDALVAACSNGECVLFAGTGVSAAVGQPTWREALLAVLRICEARDPNPRWGRLVREVGGEQYDLVADMLLAELGPPRFYELLREVVGPSGRPAAMPLLRELRGIPFAGVMSNLWDGMAGELFAHRRPVELDPDSTAFADTLRGGEFFVLNAFGSLARNTLLLTAEEFEDYLADHSAYARFLGSLFVTRTMLFVGTGVAGIEDLLRGAGVRGPGSRRHFALVPWSTEAELHRERLKRRYNVELVLYSASPGHPEVEQFVTSLGRKIHRHRATSGVAAPSGGVPLASVRLRNIGPFEDVELDFAPGWNVLLGNNGCGKSTVLRAIALAVCGDDERALRAGGSLLNANASSGSVQVRFGDDVVETQLTRERTRVRVTPRQITPAQTGQWLVLGFPPVRGVTTRVPDPPSERPLREPSVDDVLPLLTSEVDGRLDDLTQWLLNAIYEHAREQVSNRRRLVIEPSTPSTVTRFFSVVSRLSGDRRYEYAGVDDDTLDVMVQTPDGKVPLHLLSQGMSSVLSWTGTVITRLEELERAGGAGGEHAGLVLVDEIDAHLHPSWQWTIVEAIRREFPRLQVVATTHSPLVVGSMETGKVFRLTRDAEQRVAYEELHADYRGWRADQILSGPAFDTSPRDPGTEGLLDDYARLACLERPDADERRRLSEVADALDVRLPAPDQREEARQARALIEAAAASQIAAIPPSERAAVLAALQLQVQEAITGSRPSG